MTAPQSLSTTPYPAPGDDQLTFKLRAHHSHDEAYVEASARVETKEEAQAIAALFPKSARVMGTTLSGCLDGNLQSTVGYVHFWVELQSNGVTGARNETGLKRYRSFRRWAERLGFATEWTAQYGNSIKTEAEFENYLQAGGR